MGALVEVDPVGAIDDDEDWLPSNPDIDLSLHYAKRALAFAKSADAKVNENGRIISEHIQRSKDFRTFLKWLFGVSIPIITVFLTWFLNRTVAARSDENRVQTIAVASGVVQSALLSQDDLILAAERRGKLLEQKRQEQFEIDHPAPIASAQPFKRVK